MILQTLNNKQKHQHKQTDDSGTKMINVNIKVDNIDPQEGEEWANEIVNVYADMEVSEINASKEFHFIQSRISGMNDTTPDDIELKIDEYITMNEAFAVQDISCN